MHQQYHLFLVWLVIVNWIELLQEGHRRRRKLEIPEVSDSAALQSMSALICVREISTEYHDIHARAGQNPQHF